MVLSAIFYIILQPAMPWLTISMLQSYFLTHFSFLHEPRYSDIWHKEAIHVTLRHMIAH